MNLTLESIEYSTTQQIKSVNRILDDMISGMTEDNFDFVKMLEDNNTVLEAIEVITGHIEQYANEALKSESAQEVMESIEPMERLVLDSLIKALKVSELLSQLIG